MGARGRTLPFVLDSAPSSPNMTNSTGRFRHLSKSELGGVIFGCKNNTMEECLHSQLFGLPAQHFSYVRNIDPGLPLFLFNYSTRELYGIFEAASFGGWCINPYAWMLDGYGRTLFPAQVQIRVRVLCQPLPESLFKPILLDNFYNETHLLFELDHVQAYKLICEFVSLAFAPISSMPQNTTKWRSIGQALPAYDKREENGYFEPQVLKENFANSLDLDVNSGGEDVFLCSNDGNQQLERSLDSQGDLNDKDLIDMRSREFAIQYECSGASMNGQSTSTWITVTTNDVSIGQETFQKAQKLTEEKNEESSCDLALCPNIIFRS